MKEARKARPEQLPEIVALSDRVFRKPGQTSMGAAFSQLFSVHNSDHLLIVEEDGLPVSLVGLYPAALQIAGCSIPVASMGSVCTDPNYRGRNYASTLVRRSLELLHDEGASLLFVSGDRSLYIRNDCMEVGETQQFLIESPEQWALEQNAERDVADWQQNDVEGMLKALQSEGVYFERTVEQFLELIKGESLLSCYPAKQHILVSRKSGSLDAYLVFGSWDKEGTTLGEVIEYAGADDAIIQLLREAMIKHGIAKLTVSIPNYRKTLAHLLVSLGNNFRTGTIPGTIRMINFPGLWNQLQPHFRAVLGDAECSRLQCEPVKQGFRISLGGEFLVLDSRMATTLVFNGPHLVANSKLKEALCRVFPIPCINPNNLNYI